MERETTGECYRQPDRWLGPGRGVGVWDTATFQTGFEVELMDWTGKKKRKELWMAPRV